MSTTKQLLDAARFVIENDFAAPNALFRHLHKTDPDVRPGDAGPLLDELKWYGIVGESRGISRRKLLVAPGDLDRALDTIRTGRRYTREAAA